GDTAFRSLRMVIEDYLKIDPKAYSNRFLIAIPIFIISGALMFIDFNLLWRYFNWANQATAVIALFVSSAYLFLKKRNYFVTLIPGVLMLYMVILYLLTEQIGFGLDMNLSYYISVVLVGIILVAFAYQMKEMSESIASDSDLLNDQKDIVDLYPELVTHKK